MKLRSGRLRQSVLPLFCCIVTFATCSPPIIQQAPLPRGMIAPVERPEMILHIDGFPAEPSNAEGISFNLPLIAQGYRSVEAVEDVDETATYSLEFMEPAEGIGDPVVYRLTINRAATSYLPRLTRGESYKVHYFQNHRGIFLPPSQGITIFDEQDRLLYLLSTDEAVPLRLLPDGLTLLPSQRTAFETTLINQSGCHIMKRHQFVDVTTEGRKSTLTSGEEKELIITGRVYRLVLFDYSLSDDDIECLMEAPPHFSFMLAGDRITR